MSGADRFAESWIDNWRRALEVEEDPVLAVHPVRFGDGGTQGALTLGVAAQAIAGIGVGVVGGAVDRECWRVRGDRSRTCAAARGLQ